MRVRCSTLRVRPGGLWQFLGWAGLAGALPLALLAAQHPRLAFMAVPALIPALSRWAYSFPRRRVAAEVIDGQIRLVLEGGDRDVLVGDLLGAYADGPHGLVLLQRNGTRIQAELEDATAADVLRAFGFDLATRALSAPLQGELGPFSTGLLVFWFTLLVSMPFCFKLLGEQGPVTALGLSIAAAGAFVARFGHQRVLVGADGVRVTGGLREAFVPFADIVDLHELGGAEPRAIEIVRRDATSLKLPTARQSAAQVAALVSRLRAGLASGARPAPDSSRPLDQLARNGRSVEQWQRELHRIHVQGTPFRDQPIEAHDLERVLADASAPAVRRVGAALALKVAGDAAPASIQAAARTSAHEDVRRALEAVCDDALDDALAARLERAS